MSDNHSNDEWLSAHATLQIVASAMGEWSARIAIATRAHAGLMRTKATRFMRDKQTRTDIELPAEFWWARGQAALEQNWVSGDFETWIDHRVHLRAFGVQFLRADVEKLLPSSGTQMIEPRSTKQSGASRKHIFIGHGHSQAWRALKDFIEDRLSLPYDEFNRVPVAGVANTARLAQMLDTAAVAFVILTGEDEQRDGNMRARMNAIHEVGLFQGRLGFTKAIVILEDGCEEFSNIAGLGQIRFPKGNISAAFEDVRRVLEREGILRPGQQQT